MTFIIECKNPYKEEDTIFNGPFSSRKDAEIYLLLPLDSVGITRCERRHTVHELVAPTERNISFSLLTSVVREYETEVRREKAVDLARKSPVFAANADDSRIMDPTFEELRDRKIATIKALRSQYEGLGLKESKEIVDEWVNNLNGCWHYNQTEFPGYCPDCQVFVK
jgi:ribosomal protein L7/L12